MTQTIGAREQLAVTDLQRLKRTRKIITGNEVYPSGKVPAMRNCLQCGMIYVSQLYLTLSRCHFCNAPLGKGQAKRADASLAKAVEHRDQLLHFQTTAAARTSVLDDESDYFEMDASSYKWMDEEERQAAQAAQERRAAEQAELGNKRLVALDLTRGHIVRDGALDGTAADVYDILEKL